MALYVRLSRRGFGSLGLRIAYNNPENILSCLDDLLKDVTWPCLALISGLPVVLVTSARLQKRMLLLVSYLLI